MVDDETRWNILARNSHAAEPTSDGREWGCCVDDRIKSWVESMLWYTSGWHYGMSLLPWGERHEDMRP